VKARNGAGALADPRFRRLLAGSSVSSFGDSALYLTLGIWAKDLTGSNAAAGLIFLALGLPSLLAPVAGHLVDRFRRKPVLMAANAVTGAAVLSLLLIHSRGQLWLMYAVAACYGASFIVLTFAVIAALGRPPSFFGVLMSVQAIGSISGGLVVTLLIRRLGEPRTLGLGLAAWVLASLLYTIPSLVTACAALVIFGFAGSLYAVALATATQRFTPPGLQGRVGATAGMLTNLSQTMSIAIGAALVGLVSYRVLLLAVAAVAGLAALPVLARPAPAGAVGLAA
jgi:MFS family permease